MTSEVSVVNPKISSSASCFSGKERGGNMFGGLVSCSLKRKRPPSLEIPNVLREICTDIVKLSGAAAEGRGDGAVPVSFGDSGVGVYSLKGKKKFMEDAHKISSSSDGKKAFFGVYDGHGGSKAVEFVAENLHLKIFEMLENAPESESKEEAVKTGYLKTEEEFLRQGYGSGTCCVTALIEGGKEMTVSNLGDCRAVLCRDGVAECLTSDHNPTREDERRRIEDKGGYVEFHRGTWRVHGTLAVSRSIGDAHLQGWVIAEPDSKIIQLTPDMEYLILASDGLWDEISNQEAVDIVRKVCTSTKKELLRSSPIPWSKSSRVTFVNPNPKRRILHHALHEPRSTVDDDEPCVENGSPPPAKCRRISTAKQLKIKNSFPNDENAGVVEKPGYGGVLMAACKELVDVAAGRGSWDDVTVMIVDLKYYRC